MTTFRHYDPQDYYDELINAEGRPRPAAKLLIDKIKSLPVGDLAMRQKAAEALLLRMGITFNVYGRDEGTEKIFPFDIIPRIVSSEDWVQIETGLKQRIFALNAFIQDIYNEKKSSRTGDTVCLTTRIQNLSLRSHRPRQQIQQSRSISLTVQQMCWSSPHMESWAMMIERI